MKPRLTLQIERRDGRDDQVPGQIFPGMLSPSGEFRINAVTNSTAFAANLLGNGIQDSGQIERAAFLLSTDVRGR